jgi:uncharacterized protein DUF4389
MSETSTVRGHPLQVRGELTEPLSRWLWLVKWVLLIPHVIVLAFLCVAFAVVTVIAFFAVLITGRYPEPLFRFNVGVLRWTWRVVFYGYGALGTDRYPPFSLREEPDYPATLALEYPAHLSRGLVLVKWWLLAIPHYLLLGALAGGVTFAVDAGSNRTTIGLLAAVVIIVGVALLFSGRYPRGLFDLAMGVNRWSLRVAVYSLLMTDVYPPFRLDQGGDEVRAEEPGDPGPLPPARTALAPPPNLAGRVIALALGVLLVLPGLALAGVGATGLWLDTQRDDAGFLSTPVQSIDSSAAAVTIENVDLDIDGATARYLDSNDLGTVRVRVSSADGSPVFVGIAPQADVDRYLSGAAHDEISDIHAGALVYRHRPGAATVTPPAGQPFWTASTDGTGARELRWRVTSGKWAIVTARSDGAAGVHVRAAVAARVPGLTGVASGVTIAGLLVLLLGIALIAWGAHGLGRHAAPPGPGPAGSEPTGPLPAPASEPSGMA